MRQGSADLWQGARRRRCRSIVDDEQRSQRPQTPVALRVAGSARNTAYQDFYHGLLDEIGDMPLGTQGKILRALEDRKIQRLGAEAATEVDVRIISATNHDLAQLVEEIIRPQPEASFRRLNVRARERSGIFTSCGVRCKACGKLVGKPLIFSQWEGTIVGLHCIGAGKVISVVGSRLFESSRI